MLEAVDIKLTDFNPDLADNANMLVADNVLFDVEGLVPHNGFKETTKDSAKKFSSSVNKIITVLDSTFMLGTKLFELRSEWTPMDRTKSGVDYNAIYDVVEMNNKLIFSTQGNHIQSLSLTDGSAKTDDLINFEAKTLGVVQQFLFAGNIIDTMGEQKSLVKWSAINDETDFTPSASTQSGSQQLIEGGAIQKIIGGQYGLIFLDESIYRVDFTGGALIMKFQQIDNIGLNIRDSVVRSGDGIYFFSRDGLRVTNGGASQHVGKGIINKWFYDLWDGKSMNAFKVPDSDLIYWAFRDKENNSRVLVYNTVLNKFSALKFPFDAIGLYRVPQVDLDSISSTLDDYDGSFDQVTKYSPELGIVRDGFFYTFDKGSFLDSTLQTGFVDLENIRTITRLNPDNNNKVDIKGKLFGKLYSDSTPTESLLVPNHPVSYDINTRLAARKLSAYLELSKDFGILNNIKVTVHGNSRR